MELSTVVLSDRPLEWHAIMETVLILLQTLVVIGAIFMGVRMGGIGIGLWGALGTAVLVFVFRLRPGEPPVAAFLIIIAVILASSAMQAAGGIDYLVGLAVRIIRRNPARVTIIAPVVGFFFTMGAGTGNIFLALIPVIYESAYHQGIRPERPLAAATVASALGITASPVSAAMAAYLTLMPADFGLGKILVITVPAALVACVVMGIVQNRIGKELADDPEYQRRVQERIIEPSPALVAHSTVTAPAADGPVVGTSTVEPLAQASLTRDEPVLPRTARISALIFLNGVGLVVLLGAFPTLRPTFTAAGKSARLDMTTSIQLIMLTAALVIMLVTKVRPPQVLKADLLPAGFTAAVALLGIAWLVDTFIANNTATVVVPIGRAVASQPLFLAVALFIVCGLTTSQSATTRTVIPISLAAGLAAPVTTALWSSLIGVWMLPANGPQLAAVEIDRTGTTRLTANPLLHSFTIPLLVGWVTCVAVGLGIAQFVH